MSPIDEPNLDPKDWVDLRAHAHEMLDRSLNRLENAKEGRVWTPLTEAWKTELSKEVPISGMPLGNLVEKLSGLLPFGVGNTHPRFFGWVHGSGNAGGVLAEMAAAAMNANVGGRDHGAIYVEQQVIAWCRDIMGFPDTASGLICSGTSMATIVAVKTARDRRLGFQNRKTGINDHELVGYASEQAHACVARAFDMIGIGSDALRKIPCSSDFSMDLDALTTAIARDKAEGRSPFVVIGTAGAVNVGAIDDLDALATIANEQELWFHIDGAFGATGILSDEVRPKLKGLDRADSLAFDFHKWLHVNYDAGCVLIRDGDAHLRSFSDRPEYLAGAERGLAAGSPWPVDYGPELSRGFRALKIWAHLLEHGTSKLGDAITRNCEQARYLGDAVEAAADFELLAPVALNIVCFRFTPQGRTDLDALNNDIVVELQEQGIAAPSTTRLHGKLAIRVNITNHRTRFSDLDLLMTEVERIGRALAG